MALNTVDTSTRLHTAFGFVLLLLFGVLGFVVSVVGFSFKSKTFSGKKTKTETTMYSKTVLKRAPIREDQRQQMLKRHLQDEHCAETSKR